MRKTLIVLLVLSVSFAFSQRGGSRGGWSQQRQVDPKKVPKIVPKRTTAVFKL